MTIKKLLILIITLSIAFLSCERKVDPPIYCVNRIIQSPDSIIISQSDYEQACYLFELNNIDYSDLQFTRFRTDELNYIHIRCYQFINNLKIFTQIIDYHFNNNGMLYIISTDKLQILDIYNKPLMIHDSVVKKYLEQFMNDTEYIESRTDEEIQAIVKGCFDIEFGYYDLNAGIPDAEKNFTTAWHIFPSNKPSQVPEAYLNDKTGQCFYYDNGIIINK